MHKITVLDYGPRPLQNDLNTEFSLISSGPSEINFFASYCLLKVPFVNQQCFNYNLMVKNLSIILQPTKYLKQLKVRSRPSRWHLIPCMFFQKDSVHWRRFYPSSYVRNPIDSPCTLQTKSNAQDQIPRCRSVNFALLSLFI